MKTYSVTLHMDNGERIYPNPITANNEDELFSIITMGDLNNVPPNNRFNGLLSKDERIYFCVGKISYISYKEV